MGLFIGRGPSEIEAKAVIEPPEGVNLRTTIHTDVPGNIPVDSAIIPMTWRIKIAAAFSFLH